MNGAHHIAAAFVLVLAATGARAAEVSVAVAANFAAPMQKIAAAFEKSTGHKAQLTVGSTGKFVAQIKNGAPFHVLLAADSASPAALLEEKLAVADTQFTYATGRLVLWSAQAGLVDANADILRKAGDSKLAIADPKLAPYGAAAMAVLAKLNVLPLWQDKLVQGESIVQAYQFVASGNAQLGFVALSQVMNEGRIDKGSAWVVPANLHGPLKQDAVLLARGRDNLAALALLQYLRGDEARKLMRGYGYEH